MVGAEFNTLFVNIHGCAWAVVGFKARVFTGLRAAAAYYTQYEGGSCVVTNSSATPWTVARQVPLPVEFSSILTGVGIRSHLQGIVPTQGWNPGLLHRRQILYRLSRQGSPKYRILKVAMVARSCIFF